MLDLDNDHAAVSRFPNYCVSLLPYFPAGGGRGLGRVGWGSGIMGTVTKVFTWSLFFPLFIFEGSLAMLRKVYALKPSVRRGRH